MTELAQYQQVSSVQRVLHTARTIAIVGLSNNPLRASHFVVILDFVKVTCASSMSVIARYNN